MQVLGQQVRRLFAERDDPLLAAFAAHVQLLALEVDVREVETDGLGAPQARGVDELDEGPVPQRERAVALQPRKRGFDLRRLGDCPAACASGAAPGPRREPWSARE